jgi:4-hydroxy-2-oxoheptanedioate aldolase
MIGSHNRVKKRLQAGKVATGVVCRTLSPTVVELIGLAGFDFVWLDMEHAPADFGLIENLCRAADATEMSSLVRVPDKSPSHILRALEAGAGIINVPQVEERAEAEAVVKAAKYYPLGERGYCSSSRGTVYGFGGKPTEVFAAANERVMTMIQIESARGVEKAAEICAVPGLDIVFIGLGDLSQSLGCVGQFDNPKLLDGVHRVLEAIRAHGKVAAMQTETAESASRWMTAGVRVLCCSVDITAIARTLLKVSEEFERLRH